MKRNLIAAIALAIPSFALPVISTADLTPPDARKAAADFTLAASKGAPIKLSSYKGRVVLLDFWATWCTGCKTEIPWYMKFLDKYKDRGLSVVGVALDDDGWKSVRPFLEEHKINYPIVIGSWDLGDRFGFNSMPATLLIDRNGKIADMRVGMVDKDAFDREIQILLKEPQAPPPSATAVH
jgi:peroxiredoxin